MDPDSSLGSCCGRCFRPVHPSIGGFILSCECFLCFACAKTSEAQRVTMCLSCGKRNIGALNLSENELPDDVQAKITDPVVEIGRVCESLQGHIKYYKQMMQKMRVKIQQLNKENGQLKEILNGGPDTQRQFLQNAAQQPQRRPQTSLSPMLSNPVNAATLPQPASVLGKRPDTSQPQQQQQLQQRPAQRPAQQSAHFQNHPAIGAVGGADPPAKRAQTARPLTQGQVTGRPSTSVSSGGGGGSGGGSGGGQRVEVSRVVSRDPLLYQPQHQQNLQNQQPEHLLGRHAAFDVSPPRQRTAPQQQQSKSPSEEDNNMWGFRGSSAASDPHANATAPSSLSHTVTPRGPDIDRGHDNSRGIRDSRDSRDQWGEDRENYRESRDRMSEPVLDRPLSNPVANRSPMFATPSRLRSPHTAVPRVGSSGGGSGGSGGSGGYRPGSGASMANGSNSSRPGSGASTSGSATKHGLSGLGGLGGVRLGSAGKQPGPANPFQGVGVTLSQHQMPPPFGAATRG